MDTTHYSHQGQDDGARPKGEQKGTETELYIDTTWTLFRHFAAGMMAVYFNRSFSIFSTFPSEEPWRARNWKGIWEHLIHHLWGRNGSPGRFDDLPTVTQRFIYRRETEIQVSRLPGQCCYSITCCPSLLPWMSHLSCTGYGKMRSGNPPLSWAQRAYP